MRPGNDLLDNLGVGAGGGRGPIAEALEVRRLWPWPSQVDDDPKKRDTGSPQSARAARNESPCLRNYSGYHRIVTPAIELTSSSIGCSRSLIASLDSCSDPRSRMYFRTVIMTRLRIRRTVIWGCLTSLLGRMGPSRVLGESHARRRRTTSTQQASTRCQRSR